MIRRFKERHKFFGGWLKWGEGNFALIAAHPKLGIVNGGVGKGFSAPMKGMAKGTLNGHIPKTMDLPSRVKRLASNGNRLWLLRMLLWWWQWRNNLIKQKMTNILAKSNL